MGLLSCTKKKSKKIADYLCCCKLFIAKRKKDDKIPKGERKSKRRKTGAKDNEVKKKKKKLFFCVQKPSNKDEKKKRKRLLFGRKKASKLSKDQRRKKFKKFWRRKKAQKKANLISLVKSISFKSGNIYLFICYIRIRSTLKLNGPRHLCSLLADSGKQRFAAEEILRIGSENIAARVFTFRELATATRNFNSENLLGEGGFGRVYKGQLKGSNEVVFILFDRLRLTSAK